MSLAGQPFISTISFTWKICHGFPLKTKVLILNCEHFRQNFNQILLYVTFSLHHLSTYRHEWLLQFIVSKKVVLISMEKVFKNPNGFIGNLWRKPRLKNPSLSCQTRCTILQPDLSTLDEVSGQQLDGDPAGN